MPLLTETERHVLEALGEVWNRFTTLPVQHPADHDEFRLAIHMAQNIILSRPTLRGLYRKPETV